MRLILIFLSCDKKDTDKSCNSNLLKSGGNYLMELENAKLNHLQEKSICTILDSEYKKCSENIKEELGKVFNPKMILGTICQPHLPAPVK